MGLCWPTVFFQCSGCRIIGDTFRSLSLLWEQSVLFYQKPFDQPDAITFDLPLPVVGTLSLTQTQTIALARFRLSNERFNASLAQTLVDPIKSVPPVTPGGTSIFGDSLLLLLCSVLFAQSATDQRWRRPVRMSFSTYLLLKSMTNKRYEEGCSRFFMFFSCVSLYKHVCAPVICRVMSCILGVVGREKIIIFFGVQNCLSFSSHCVHYCDRCLFVCLHLLQSL